MDRLLKLREVAEIFQVPPSWIYDRTRRRGPERIPQFKMGKYLRFNEKEVAAFIDSHRRPENCR